MNWRTLRFAPFAVVASLAIGSAAGAQCLPSFVAFGTSCYRLTRSFMPWLDALAEAQTFAGGSLVSVGSQSENDFLMRTFHTTREVIWIGLNDMRVEGEFVWANGDPLTFTNWLNGEPNDAGLRGEDAVQLKTTNGRWTDEAASSSQYGGIEVAQVTSVVPEPLTTTFLGAGLLGMTGVGYARRRRAVE